MRIRTDDDENAKTCSSSGSHGITRSLPCFDAASESLHVAEAFIPVLCCLTGSTGLGRSGAEEDDFLRLRQGAGPRLEAGQRDRSLQIDHPALGLVRICAN